jgi:hypothetical protein
MALIQVDPAELLATASSLDAALAVGDEVVAGHGSLTASAGAAGRGDVTGAIDDFLAAWANGMSFINEDGRALSQLLRLAGQAYQAAEQNVEQAAG